MRIEVLYTDRQLDGRSHRILHGLPDTISRSVSEITITDVYLVDGVDGLDEDSAREIFADPVAQTLLFGSHAADVVPGWDLLLEITARAGVADPVAHTARTAIETSLGRRLADGSVVQTARQYLIRFAGRSDATREAAAGAFHNPLIQQAEAISRAEWESGRRPPALYPHRVPPSPPEVLHFDLQAMNGAALQELSRARLLALSADEMQAVRGYFAREDEIRRREKLGLGGEATDVELEMIAQTWSEHCKHKIFSARILYREGGRTETINGLFGAYIRGTTEKLRGRRRYLRSVFHDNAGIVEFDDENLICFKVETHNSPSALDPYGGAITGIVGVNRDILGTGKGAKPIFNTDVLCFGRPDAPPKDIPEGLLHPRQVLEGVHHGIVDGGNQSGIPTVAGAFLFDESFTGKPLVFCGTGGILPAKIGGEDSWEKHVRPGHLAVMVGGRIGKDGIHGATFSSLALDETSPTSAVQIGDPITQKKMADFLLEARDQGLYEGITDNGAGGLSSSLGEMARDAGGVRIDLEKCPLKYQGLAPWEILVSESQERMSLSVPPEKIDSFLALAARRDVEATVVGEFTDSGHADIAYEGRIVGSLSLAFLHDGLPEMRLDAVWTPPRRDDSRLPDLDPDGVLSSFLAILAEPNVASKEWYVRQYDHEVQVGSVIKPFLGVEADAPSDGAVLKPVYGSTRGVTVTHGICPRYGDADTYHMAMCAVDEALRAHVALGGDPDRISGLDNFCWPDPVSSAENPDGAYKLAQLVRACRGLQDACLAYGLPLISGKDSMKNDARIGGKKLSVRPTLLVSLMGIIPDVRKAGTTDFKTPGDIIYLAGETRGEMGGTTYEAVEERRTGAAVAMGGCPTVDVEQAVKLYRKMFRAMKAGLVASCHDLSDGGLAVALAESALGGRLGAEADLAELPGGNVPDLEDARLLFCETPSRFLLSVRPEHREETEALFAGLPVRPIGRVTDDGEVRISRSGRPVTSLSMDMIEAAWRTQW